MLCQQVIELAPGVSDQERAADWAAAPDTLRRVSCFPDPALASAEATDGDLVGDSVAAGRDGFSGRPALIGQGSGIPKSILPIGLRSIL